ncbi:glutamate racemase [Tindallia magadiensis]|uniref:Glutamate racemase n=1 Tax=Tindallia magadiensis TaxID=69895 RepID=A0A1I3FTA2_9FIRM|nr:glutamate racemase [Tindallia magadiensis]SFI14429.1 glutamate racemase [Tindallia magadiensis]
MEEVNQGPIGVFDSGYGGISVLANLIEAMPKESFIYISDSINAPYGELESQEVLNHALSHMRVLEKESAKAVVIACNTATSAAAAALRAKYSFPIIGMEPAVKPAIKKSGSGKILVAATGLTLKERKFAALVKKMDLQHNIVTLPCHGLVEIIEEYGPESKEVTKKLDELLAPLQPLNFDGVVLGCTHYVLIKNQWKAALPEGTKIYDGNEGTVKQTMRMIMENTTIIKDHSMGKVSLMDSSQNDERLEKSKQLLQNQLRINGIVSSDQLEIELRKNNELCKS